MIKRLQNKIKKLNNKEIILNILFILFITTLFVIYTQDVYAADPTLVTKLNTAFKKIKDYLIKLSTPIAAVAILTGVLIRKLSFGDEEKMVKGKKVIVNAIIGYTIVMLIDLIIKFIEALT